jgi:hypothetical protein
MILPMRLHVRNLTLQRNRPFQTSLSLCISLLDHRPPRITEARAAWSDRMPALTRAASKIRNPKMIAVARITGLTAGGLGLVGR